MAKEERTKKKAPAKSLKEKRTDKSNKRDGKIQKEIDDKSKK